jgi:plasmid stabilization system protein ParE
MTHKVIYYEDAQDDLQAAYIYYENERVGLGEEFLQRVEETVEYIRQYPLHFPILSGKTRKSNLTRFPYAVFYLIHLDTIKITSVMHLKRNPEEWFE